MWRRRPDTDRLRRPSPGADLLGRRRQLARALEHHAGARTRRLPRRGSSHRSAVHLVPRRVTECRIDCRTPPCQRVEAPVFRAIPRNHRRSRRSSCPASGRVGRPRPTCPGRLRPGRRTTIRELLALAAAGATTMHARAATIGRTTRTSLRIQAPRGLVGANDAKPLHGETGSCQRVLASPDARADSSFRGCRRVDRVGMGLRSRPRRGGRRSYHAERAATAVTKRLGGRAP